MYHSGPLAAYYRCSWAPSTLLLPPSYNDEGVLYSRACLPNFKRWDLYSHPPPSPISLNLEAKLIPTLRLDTLGYRLDTNSTCTCTCKYNAKILQKPERARIRENSLGRSLSNLYLLGLQRPE